MTRKKSAAEARPPRQPSTPPRGESGEDSADAGRTSLPFAVVALGASAGGVDALGEFFKSLPAPTDMAFVVIPHLASSRESVLPQILGRLSSIRVREIQDGMAVESGQVYVLPAGKCAEIAEGVLRLGPRDPANVQQRPIDQFMRSLARAQGGKSIGVVLSGTGNDGTLGMEEISGAGGITFAQDDTAEHTGMPRSAMAAGVVDYVLPPDEIAREIGRIARHPYVSGLDEAALAAPPNEASLQEIIAALRRTTGVDFTHYKRSTLYRRVARRMLLHKVDDLGQYALAVAGKEDEAHALYHDVLINVTSFFRDAEAFAALKSEVFPALAKSRGSSEPMRVWVLGCSTGEEAYSIAMAFSEYVEESGERITLQIFATDLKASAVAQARVGLYPKGIAQDVSAERLRRFFVEVDGSYRICKPIRDMCIFARHNALADPPFSRLDLVSCRNMLIYLEQPLQQRVIAMLHRSLRLHGFLWLGGSETIGSYRELFELKNARHKIYGKRGVDERALAELVWPRRSDPAMDARPAVAQPNPAGGAQKEAERVLLTRYAPPSVVVSQEMEIVQVHGETGPFLTPAVGRASLNILKMLRDDLVVPVRDAISRARRDKAPVRLEGLTVRGDGGERCVDVLVTPLRDAATSAGAMLVTFEETSSSLNLRQSRSASQADELAREKAALPQNRRDATSEKEITRLREELAATRDYLQSVIEQQDAANEELQAANAEVQSANEELQSINEELETSKEEIQSSNEELSTVNDELQHRNDEVSDAHADLGNLIDNVQIGIVMLAPDLRIRRFTPVAGTLLKLVPTDIGRPLKDLKTAVPLEDLHPAMAQAIESGASSDHELQDRRGCWYSVRIRPYRTLDQGVDGAVLLFVDIDTLKKAEIATREAERALAALDRSKNEFIATLGHELRNPLAGVRNAARVAAKTRDPQMLTQACEIIERQTVHMVRLINDLLDVARISNRKVDLRIAPVDLAAVLNAAVQSTSDERKEHGQVLTLELPERPAWMRGDAMRLEQIVVNLLNNASKFTPNGGHIRLSLESGAASNGVNTRLQALIRVRDNGLGIRPEAMGHIFDLFVQDQNPPDRAPSGIGLGLSLAKQLAVLHGGTVEAFSGGPGRGSEFVVRLPLDAEPGNTEPATRHAVAPSAARPRRLLIIDDNRDASESLRAALSLDGHDVRTELTAMRGLATAAEFRPEAVLLDISLPDMNGFEAARKLRQEPATRDVHIITVSGYGEPATVERSLKAGSDAHLTKPVDPDEVLRLIARGRSHDEPT